MEIRPRHTHPGHAGNPPIRTGPREIEALRDFFFAADAQDLGEAYAALAAAAPADAPAPDVGDWQAEEYAFNRLFVGPAAPISPPFASVHLEPEGLVMGRSTLWVRRVYQVLGLASPWQGPFPDDHLSLELDAVAAMDRALQVDPDPALAELRRAFVAGHMAAWVPAFAGRVLDDPAATPAVAHAARRLLHWLDEQAEAASRAVSRTDAHTA